MTETEVYEKFVEWLKTAPMSFPDSEDMKDLKNIYKEKELDESATAEEFSVVQKDDNRMM